MNVILFFLFLFKLTFDRLSPIKKWIKLLINALIPSTNKITTNNISQLIWTFFNSSVRVRSLSLYSAALALYAMAQFQISLNRAWVVTTQKKTRIEHKANLFVIGIQIAGISKCATHYLYETQCESLLLLHGTVNPILAKITVIIIKWKLS